MCCDAEATRAIAALRPISNSPRFSPRAAPLEHPRLARSSLHALVSPRFSPRGARLEDPRLARRSGYAVISPRFSPRAARLENPRLFRGSRHAVISPRLRPVAVPAQGPDCAGAPEVNRERAACRQRRTTADSTYAGGRRGKERSLPRSAARRAEWAASLRAEQRLAAGGCKLPRPGCGRNRRVQEHDVSCG
jgi:hypothetical protein